MNKLLTEFAAVLQGSPKRLVGIADADAERKSPAGGWSKKEILGHLIDSASNNHQRFVRAQFAAHIDYPAYDQDRWVSAQAYATASWADLVNLWLLYNRHLLHILRNLPEEARSHEISIGGKPPATVEAVAQDYLRHLNHHLAQIL
jgi:DinB superfamily